MILHASFLPHLWSLMDLLSREIQYLLPEIGFVTHSMVGYISIDWDPGGYPGETVMMHSQFQHLASMIIGRAQTLMRLKHSASLAWTQSFGSR